MSRAYQASDASVLRATRADSGGRPLARVDGDRTCAAPGCQTRLSAYNRYDRCWQHEPVHRYTLTVHAGTA
jgi:hypothetical protein